MTKEVARNSENNEFEFLLDLANFCRIYTNEICNRVIRQSERISKDSFILNALHELRVREEKERKEFIDNFSWRLKKTVSKLPDDMSYDLHNHPITHSRSYRDVLYDLLVKD